ncbi:hypothetical protein [Sphingosinicella terrae]|uniref:hypothetical protein n=1 Tax=Sphingosinicella terrae TaxID=2172047 RepID=UPI000E0DD2DE|nr:hypothetical protein [Sphingosinicella terrae]
MSAGAPPPELGAANVDTILDFTPGEDKILLDDAIFLGLTIAELPSDAFALGNAATSAVHRIIYNQTTGVLLFDVDGVGGGAATHFTSFDEEPTLSAPDFIIS